MNSPSADPSFSAPPVAEYTDNFRNLTSAHEAGHATLAITLGARIEAVYARIDSRLANGNFRLRYMTRLGALGRAGLELRDKVLVIAGGGAGEALLLGRWHGEEVCCDRADLEALGFFNFEYCVARATELLEANRTLLVAVREKIDASVSNMKHCKLAKNKTHVVLATGHQVEKLYNKLGFRINSCGFDIELAKARLLEA